MPRNFPTLPPEIWELIIRDYNLYRLKYIKTIKMIPSRHCIIRTVYCQLIQPYIDHLCQLIYSTKCNIINKSYIFNKYNLIDIIEYIDITIEDLPKINIRLDIHNNIILEYEYKNIILKYEYKRVKINTYYIEYYMNSTLSRIGGPAIIRWHRNGNKCELYYLLCNSLHCNDGPAIVEWRENGNKYLEEYHICGKLDRIDGPAIIKWDDDGNILYERYYLRGQQYEKEEYYDLIKNIEFIL